MPELHSANVPRARWDYTSPTSVNGIPIVHVALGGRDHGRYHPGVARGMFAFGDVAVGLVAVGGVAIAPVSLGGVAVGLVAMAGVALGLVAVGAVAIGVTAVGAVAFGLHALGAVTPNLLLAWRLRPSDDGPAGVPDAITDGE